MMGRARERERDGGGEGVVNKINFSLYTGNILKFFDELSY